MEQRRITEETMRNKVGLFAIMLALSLAFWAPSALAGPLLGDQDGDGVDDLLDNCIDVSNSGQIDTDGDSCGNACDADYTQTGLVGSGDFNTFRESFGLSVGQAGYNPSVDANGDNIISSFEFNFFRTEFGGTPGLAGPGIPIHFHDLCHQAAFP